MTIASFRSSQAVSGCAFSSVTLPCVAQRVWPRPVVTTEPFGPAAATRLSSGPDRARVVQAVVFEKRDAGGVVPAVLEALQPCRSSGFEALRPTYPMIPHIWSPFETGTSKARLM